MKYWNFFEALCAQAKSANAMREKLKNTAPLSAYEHRFKQSADNWNALKAAERELAAARDALRDAVALLPASLIARQAEELEKVRKDARRYQCYRVQNPPPASIDFVRPEERDAFYDAAIALSEGGGT